ncbi:alpha/beta hydrolase family protein [Cohnella sp.]|uniref:alpha/beta hydrolase family protein n=1 Tax=Cohnella sp. TaxID=1883426 RepID=UPI0035634B07
MWSSDAFLERLYAWTLENSADRMMGDSAKEQMLETKQQQLRERLLDAAGIRHVFLEREPLQPELLERREQDGLVVEKLIYTTYAGLRVPVYALYPRERQGRMPAVLACHGHGIGHRAALGLNADGLVADERGIHNCFAVQLARRGLFVLVPEMMGFGDRRLQAHLEQDPSASSYSCLPIALQLLMCGTTLAGVRISESLVALDYLETREEVDSGRIGTFGFSGGGLVASLTAAVDMRIRAAVLCGYASTYVGSILQVPHCVDNYIPGLLQVAEQPDLLGLLAPRPLFIESGEQDAVFPIQPAREAIRRLEAIYAEFGAVERLDFDIFLGGHEISGRRSFDWLASRLSEEGPS